MARKGENKGMAVKEVKEKEIELTDDPRPKDRAMWQRLRVLVEEEACHRDWGSALYRMHRTGRIDNDQREAGDKYIALIMDYRKLWRDHIGSIEVYRSSPRFDHIEKRSAITADVDRMLANVLADERFRGETEFEIRRAKSVGTRYKEAKAVVGPVNSVLEDMLIKDVWPVGERGHLEIRYALERLSYFFNTGTKQKRKNSV